MTGITGMTKMTGVTGMNEMTGINRRCWDEWGNWAD